MMAALIPLGLLALVLAVALLGGLYFGALWLFMQWAKNWTVPHG